MAELEDTLGALLLHRSPRGVRPTDAGKALYDEASTILRHMQKLPDLVRSSGGETEGRVRLGMSSTLAGFLAGGFIDACRLAMPRVNVQLITADSLTLKERIQAHTLDVAAVFEDSVAIPFTRFALFRQRLYLVGPAIAGVADSITLDALSNVPLILPTMPNVVRELVDEAFAAAGVTPNVATEADVLYSLLAAVGAGLGHTILPKGTLADIPGHQAASAILIEPALYLTAALITSTDAPLSTAASALSKLFQTFVCEYLAANPSAGTEWIGSESNLPDR
jgi:LysR family nitrogen assimilation transcriptional regulator